MSPLESHAARHLLRTGIGGGIPKKLAKEMPIGTEEKMAKLVEKGGTIANNYIGCLISKTGEVAIGNDIPRPDKVPTLLTGQAGGGVPRPRVSIPINNFLTEGTSDGDKGEKGDDTSVLEQTTQPDEGPWTVILGRRRGEPQNRNPQTSQDTAGGPTTSPEREPIARTTQAESGS